MTAPRLPGLPPPFCATCLAESADLKQVFYDARLVMLCAECRGGSLRGGRWSFGGGKDGDPVARGLRGRRDD
jgi:hypothetical protein